MIDWTKPVQTRDGRQVRIYATDGKGEFPIHGAILIEGQWCSLTWRSDGQYVSADTQNPFDLIETRTMTQWCMVYESGSLSFFPTKFIADSYVQFLSVKPFALVPIEVTCTRGEGLE